MKLLDVLSGKKVNDSVEHRINPVYDTAKDCLINLVHSNCEEAMLFNEQLKFTENKVADKAINKGTALFQELRYKFVNNEIVKSGAKNILDIGCGYSPRGILFSNLGYNYIGADLPAVIKEIKPAVDNCAEGDKKGNLDYIAVDATNPQSLIVAVENIDGPVCIVTEGLFMYLPTYELNEYIKGLKAVLALHGGCIITPDFCMNKLLKLSVSATSASFLGSFLQKIAGVVVKQYTVPSKEKTDSMQWYLNESDDEPYKFFTSKGFIIERISVYDSNIEIKSLSFVSNRKLERLITACKITYAWKLSV